jgi:Protein of unknown function (DUF3307)
MEQLLLHLIGDYCIQSHWMATNKTKSDWAAWCHATVYSLPFLLIGSWTAVLVIYATHFAIDRYRLVRYLIWWKNVLLGDPAWRILGPSTPCEDSSAWKPYGWENCKTTGFPADVPPWLAVWLMIICDNTLHLGINFLALKYL